MADSPLLLDDADGDASYWANVELTERVANADEHSADRALSDQSIIRRHERPGGILSLYRPLKEIAAMRDKMKVKDDIERAELDLLQQQSALADLNKRIVADRDDVRRRQGRVDELEDELAGVDTIADLIQRQTKRYDLQKRLQTEQGYLNIKASQLAREEAELNRLETEYTVKSVAHSRLNDAKGDLLHDQAELAHERSLVSAKMVAKQRDKALAAASALLNSASSDQPKLIQPTDASSPKGPLSGRKVVGKAIIAEARQVIDRERRAREEAFALKVLALKDTLEQSGKKIRVVAAAKAKRLDRERQAIAKTGADPDAVLRLRMQRQATEKRRANHDADMKRREMEIIARVTREHRQDMKAEAERHARQVAARAARAITDPQVADERQRRYLRKITGGAALDPTGAATELYPSTVALVKPPSFGTGRAPQHIVDTVAARHPDVAGTTPGDNRTRATLPRPSAKEIAQIEGAVRRRSEAIARGEDRPVCGKRYPGQKYFLSQPAVVTFKDFAVGDDIDPVHVAITNVSFRDNSFRLVGIADEPLADLFAITYERPGRMAAGITVNVTVAFTPTSNVDIDTSIEFLAESGPFSVPLRALTKKTVIECDTAPIGFGFVTSGQTAERALRIVNHGALPGTFNCNLSPGTPFSMAESKGVVGAYAETAVTIRYGPVDVVDAQGMIQMEFDNAGGCWGSSKSFSVTLLGQCTPEPVYVDTDRIDMQCCISGRAYRQVLPVHNRSSAMVKVMCRVPACSRPMLQVRPTTLFLDGQATLSVQVECVVEQGTGGEFTLGFDLVTEQQGPIPISVIGRVTTSGLSFSTKTIQFGDRFLHQTTSLPLTISNPSRLPQRVGIRTTPRSESEEVFVVDPPLLHILPGRSAVVQALFTPNDTDSFAGSLQIHTNLGRHFAIRLEGVGVEAPVRLSRSVVEMAAYPNVPCVQRIVVESASHRPCRYEFVMPDAVNALAISPVVGELAPGQAMSVDLEFTPADGEGGLPRRYLVPLWVKQACLGAPPSPVVLHLEIRTRTVRPQLSCDHLLLDFGQVAVGATKVLHAVLRNIAEPGAPVDIKVAERPLSSPFSLTGIVPDQVGIGQTLSLAIQFRPGSQRSYDDVVRISDQLEIRMKGHGARLSLSVAPDTDMIDLGDVVAGDSRSTPMHLVNESPFPLQFTMDVIDEIERNDDGSASLVVEYGPRDLSPEQALDVNCCFRADHESRAYRSRVRLKVLNQPDERPPITFRARSWTRQLFVLVHGAEPQPVALAERISPAASQATLSVSMKTSARVIVGSCPISLSTIKPAPGTFEFILSETTRKRSCLRVTPPSGKLSATGELINVDIAFDLDKWHLLDTIGMITELEETLSCKLSGGYVPDGQPPATEIKIVCRIHLQD